MVMEFKNWFCLRDRESFTIDPKINPSDARFYFGRAQLDDRMRSQIKRAFIDPQVPKMMVYGPYGCGKTQTLHYLAYWLSHTPPQSCKGKPHTVHLDIEMQSKSIAAQWHLQNMEALGMKVVQQWVDSLFSKSQDFPKALSQLTDDPNVIQAFGFLRGGGDEAFAAWRWLSGQKLASKELQQIKVTRSLGEVGVGDLVNALQACGNLAISVGVRLIFFIDEMEELQNVREGDAAESWHQYIRKLADNANSSIGFVIGFKADTRDDAPRVLVRQDVISRISAHNLIELETLAAPANVQQFVREMLSHLVIQEEAERRIQADTLPSTKDTYPFTAAAFDLMCDYACQDVIKSTPRNIIRTINECAIAAWDSEKKVIDDEIVNAIAPIIFG
jgi:DNA polymerase III delta prime subunit